MDGFFQPAERDKSLIEIVTAHACRDYFLAEKLFKEYEQSLNIDLGFQDFAAELKRIRQIYAPPRGALLLAMEQNNPAGCAALRPLEENICEMKRLYVRPGFRGQAVGRMLAESVMAVARALGYRRMRLDTLASMTAARGLYASLGFYEIDAYCYNPLPDAVYMECALEAESN